jgi:hypothetical protein
MWQALLAGLALAAGAQLAHAAPLTSIDDVYPALAAKRYGDVEAFYEKVRQDRSRDAEGKFPFEHFSRSVYWHSSTDPADADYWPKVDAATQEWVAHSQKSHLAAMTRAYVLAYHAGAVQARGGSWVEVDRLAAEAQGLMERSKQAGRSDVLWHVTLLRVASVQGAPRSDVRDMILAAVAVDPHPMRLWQEASIALSPDGRGLDDLPWLMRLAVQRTSDQEGASMYARVLHGVFWHFQDFRAAPFALTGLDWNLLQRGFEEEKARFPDEYSPDLHAALACSALDQRVAAGLLARIGSHPRMDVWDLMGGKGFLEQCRKFASPHQAVPAT